MKKTSTIPNSLLLWVSLLINSLCVLTTHAVDYNWDNSVGSNDFLTPSNWVGDVAPVAGSSNYALIEKDGADKAILSSGSTANIAGLRIANSGGDGAFEQTGGTLSATASSGAASRVGISSGKTGDWTMSGGSASINAIQLGFNGSTGNLTINGGDMVIARGVNNYSLIVGNGGSGNVEISGGSLTTRTGVQVQDNSTFTVLGSGATTIGIGSQSSVDGRWVQDAGGTLNCQIDSGGITKIFVDDTGSSGADDGNVTFADGALLDVSFIGGNQTGTWDLMSWEGTLTDYGLAFAPGVNPALWSFEFVDTNSSGSPDTLRIHSEQTVVVGEYNYDANAANIALPLVAGAYSGDASNADHMNAGSSFLLSESLSPAPNYGAAGLNDGAADGNSIVSNAYFSATEFPATATYTFDLSVNTTGYEINSITTLAGLGNNGANLANQNYEVWVSQVGSSGFTLIETVNYTPFTSGNLDGNTGATKVSLSSTGGVLAVNVDQIRFVFLDDGQSFGSSDGTVYQEIDVFSSTVRPRYLYLSRMFDDGMVLQRDFDVPIWGTVASNATVTIRLDGNIVASAIAGPSGEWMAHLGEYPGDGGQAHTLTFSSPDEEDLILTDVVFGDVYIASGQSNMARTLAGVSNNAEIAVANYPLIRQIAMEQTQSSSEQEAPPVLSTWTASSPVTAGNFTAVGYYFAKELQATTGEPVGLLFSAYGGRQIQRFINPEGMATVPALSGLLQNIEDGKVGSYYDIYNAMIAPMAPYGVCGAIWYQGEQDASSGDGDIYHSKMQALIRGWRAKWAQENFAFYYVQLCNFSTTNDWAVLREAQRRALSEPDTGMAVTIDVGNDGDIHPTNKKDPGVRLASWALAHEFEQAIVYSSPLYLSSLVEGSQIRVFFEHAEGGLIVGTKSGDNPVVETAGALQNFEIAGSDKVFVSATAVIDGATVLVTNASVTDPVYVRYCFSSAPTGGNKLYNQAGFPASPFRTDAGYELDVYSGSGDATDVEKGTLIAISADGAASGMVFDRWIGAASAIADLNAASTTVTMPAHDLYLVASYRATAEATHSITVTSGHGSGVSKVDSIVMIEAGQAPFGQEFDSWTGDTQVIADVNESSTTVRMPAADVSVTAVYKDPVVQTATVAITAEKDNSSASGARSVNLTAEGTLDWGTWQTTAFDLTNRMNGGTGFTNLSAINGTVNHGAQFAASDNKYSWTNGSPISIGTNVQEANRFSIASIGDGIRLTLGVAAAGSYRAKFYMTTSSVDLSATASLANGNVSHRFTPTAGGGQPHYTWTVVCTTEGADSLIIDVTKSGNSNSILAVEAFSLAAISPEVSDVSVELLSGSTAFGISWFGEFGLPYGLEMTEDLALGAWDPVVSVLGAEEAISISLDLDKPKAFYRINLPQ